MPSSAVSASPPAAAAPAAPAPAPKQDAAGVVPPAQVAASSVADPVEVTPFKPGSARERIFKDLQKTAKVEEPPAAPPVDPKKAAKPEKPAAAAPPKDPKAEPSAVDPNAPPADPAAPVDPADPDRNAKTPKRDFWQAFDAWKGRATKAELDLAELRKQLTPENDRKVYDEKLKGLESRNKELEDHIRFVDYTRSSEYQTKYQQPYEAAWKRAMADVGQLQVALNRETGEARPATAEDLGDLVNLPLGAARERAEALFGVFANDVMAYRKEIKGLWDAQSAAIEEAKKNGSQREEQQRQQMTAQGQELQKTITETWNKANAASLEHAQYGQYFKPVEGNEEINKRLTKGFALVDAAFSGVPTDPRLTPQQREQVIQRHSAVRNRAAAFGRLVYELGEAKKQLETVTKELDEIKKTEPNVTGRNGQPTAAATPAGARAQMQAALEKIARPGA